MASEITSAGVGGHYTEFKIFVYLKILRTTEQFLRNFPNVNACACVCMYRNVNFELDVAFCKVYYELNYMVLAACNSIGPLPSCS